MPERTEGLRLSEASVRRLRSLADKAGLDEATYLERLLKREAEAAAAAQEHAPADRPPTWTGREE